MIFKLTDITNNQNNNQNEKVLLMYPLSNKNIKIQSNDNIKFVSNNNNTNIEIKIDGFTKTVGYIPHRSILGVQKVKFRKSFQKRNLFPHIHITDCIATNIISQSQEQHDHNIKKKVISFICIPSLITVPVIPQFIITSIYGK